MRCTPRSSSMQRRCVAEPVRRRIAVVTADTLGEQMAGPAIRAWAIADELASDHDVRLISTQACTVDSPRFTCFAAPASALRGAVGDAEIVVVQGFVTYDSPW